MIMSGCLSVETHMMTNVYASEYSDENTIEESGDEISESSETEIDSYGGVYDFPVVVDDAYEIESDSDYSYATEDHIHSYVYYAESDSEHIGYCECGDEVTESHVYDGLVCSLCGYEREVLIEKSKISSVIVTTNAPSSYLFEKDINLWVSAYAVQSNENQYSLFLVTSNNVVDFTGEEFFGFFSDLKNCSQIVLEEGEYYFNSNSFDFTGLASDADFPAELDFVDASIYLDTDSDYYAFSGADIKTVYLPDAIFSDGRILLGKSFVGYNERFKQIGEYSYIIPSYQEGSVVMLSNDPSYQVSLLDDTDEVIWTDPDDGTVYKKSEAIEIVDLSNSGSNNIVCYGFDTDSNSIGDLYVVTSTNANNVLKYYSLDENSNEFCYPWSKKDSDTKSSNAKKIVFRDKLKTSPYFQHVFHYCVSLTDIIGFGNIDTSNATNMACLFAGCSSLVNVDVSSMNTSKVTSIEYLFSGCTKLKKADVSNFDTSSATSMHNMFFRCSSLTELDVSNFDTNNVTDMYGMFYQCSSLTELDVSNFDTSKVTTMRSMFYNCSKLTELNVSNFSTSNVTTMYCMFYQCSLIKKIDVSNFDTSNVTDITSMFRRCENLAELNISGFDLSKVTSSGNFINGDTSLIKIWIPTTFGNCPEITLPNKMYAYDKKDNQYGINIYSTLLGKDKINGISYLKKENILIWTDPDNGKEYWSDDALQIDNQLDVNKSGTILGYQFDSDADNTADLYVVLSESPDEVLGSSLYAYSSGDAEFFKTKAKDMTRVVFKNALKSSEVCSYFYDFTKLTSIIGLENLNTENATTMQYMFHNCYKLTDLNLSQLNTKNVTDMSMMFDYCKSLTELDISHFNTSKVTTMADMFDNCESLAKLNISNIDTSNVTSMEEMFRFCRSLKILDLGNFNTSNVTTMRYMFYNCSKLTELNVSSFDTSNVTDMQYMFATCSSLTELDVSNFNTSNVTDMYGMFYQCSSLTELDVSNFDTSKVTNMNSMFAYCSGLIKLDLSNFNTINVTNMKYMFYCCRKITELDLSSFDMSKVTNIDTFLIGMNSLEKIYIPSNTNDLNIKLPSENYYGYKADGSIIDRDFTYTTLPSKDETTGLSFISSKLLLYNSFIIAVPANINMDLYVGEGTPYYQGNGNVNIEYNMLQNKNISISPAESFSLKNDDQSRSLTASVTVNKGITIFNNDTEGSVKKTSDIDESIFGDLSETYTNTMPFTIVAPANKVADNYTGSLGFTIATVPAA